MGKRTFRLPVESTVWHLRESPAKRVCALLCRRRALDSGPISLRFGLAKSPSTKSQEPNSHEPSEEATNCCGWLKFKDGRGMPFSSVSVPCELALGVDASGGKLAASPFRSSSISRDSGDSGDDAALEIPAKFK